MGNILKAFFGNYSKRELKRIQPLCDKVLALEEKYKALSDEDLQAQTPALKERLANGETLDDILPDAFAVCREASARVLQMRHFPVQIIGGIVLHQGRIAEMKTGEGKTLVATLPAYLNGLAGKGVHVVTVNDYLARRDSEWMGKLYRFLGLSVGLIAHLHCSAQGRNAFWDCFHGNSLFPYKIKCNLVLSIFPSPFYPLIVHYARELFIRGALTVYD